MRGPDAYPTVSGVAAAARVLTGRHPDLCRMRLAGESRAGRPLWLLSVGHGRRHVLVVAGAQPDAQVGGATVLLLAEQAVWDRRQLADANLTWDFLLCLDPDGTMLNETGPAGRRPSTVHFRHAFRPAAAERPEWADAFRAPGDGLPETYALAAVIDELRPVLQCTLHATDVGGGGVRLTAELPGIAEPLGKFAAELDIPVQTATHEALYWDTPGPGVHVLPPGGVRRRLTGEPADATGSTWHRPHRHGGTTAVVEVPRWASRRIADPAPHPDPAHAVSVLAAGLRKDGSAVSAALDRTVGLIGRVDDPLLRGAEQAVGEFEGMADDCEALVGPCRVPLTMAHVWALDIAARRLSLHASGMLLRLLDETCGYLEDDPNAEPSRLRARLDRRLDVSARDLISASDARWVPVGAQAELQARTVLAAVERVE
ncbi:M14 family zinc carboxypeptidase [Streptomyces sp. NBC_01190]|uniref:M14 family zinc carboxypeptidase n=1 Tax=Streptomyces sp. NBC_01190 TaxID=2903767 RepID=UPI003865D958|nr:M14 family zinc carboxypeptidase [Streptomyces sp. NBC_01190]